MNTPLRLSPIHHSLQSLNGSWRDINGMPSLLSLPEDPHHSSRLGIADLSYLTRFGVKGANAAAWLAEQEVPIPDRPNTWHSLPEGGLVARLGLTEFLVEDSVGSTIAPRLGFACQSPPAKVYPVLRQDLALGLVGNRVNELLRQTCSFDFQAISLSECPVILTFAIGVAVTVIPWECNGLLFYRIWCDGTFGTYFWRSLVEIATELEGGAIGTESVWLQSYSTNIAPYKC
jgi:sarcosine oxidase subunit gamma